MQAIITKYLGATNHKGSRLKAKCEAGSITVSYDHALNGPENHRAAAVALAEKLEWSGDLVSGCLPSGEYAHCFAEAEKRRIG